MVRIIIVNRYPAFTNGIAMMLEGQNSIFILAKPESTEVLLTTLTNVQADVILMDDHAAGNTETIAMIVKLYPDLKILLMIPDYTEPHLLKMVESGAHSALRAGADKEELIQSIIAVHNNEEHLPHEAVLMLQNILRKQIALAKLKDKPTPREMQVLRCIGAGMSIKQIAHHLDISENTVKTHRKELYEKLDVHDVVSCLNKAHDLGLL